MKTQYVILHQVNNWNGDWIKNHIFVEGYTKTIEVMKRMENNSDYRQISGPYINIKDITKEKNDNSKNTLK